jgi:hypothetical protein
MTAGVYQRSREKGSDRTSLKMPRGEVFARGILEDFLEFDALADPPALSLQPRIAGLLNHRPQLERERLGPYMTSISPGGNRGYSHY